MAEINPQKERQEATRPAAEPDRGILAEHSIAIMAPVGVVYEFCRDLRNFPLFTPQLESVEVRSDTLSHWTWKALRDQVRVEWDAEIVHDVPNSVMAWRTVADSEVKHAGTVWFRELPAERGTMVTVRLEYEPPGGRMMNAIEALFFETPKQNLSADLKRLRSLLEAGEIPTIEGQSSGRAGDQDEINPALH